MSDELETLSRRYLWWEAVDPAGHSRERRIAQVMNLGTYGDIRALETIIEPNELAAAMNVAAPGWFTPRSWSFWHGRLRHRGQDVPVRPPRRTFRENGSVRERIRSADSMGNHAVVDPRDGARGSRMARGT